MTRVIDRALLYVPELRKPLDAVIGTPDRIRIAWHRDAHGIHELLDADGNTKLGHPPQASLWEVREYQRVTHGDGYAHYEPVA